MKYFIISLPKSGTYLLSNLLTEFKIKQTFLHLGLRKYQQYDKNNLIDGQKNPLKYTHNLGIDKSINLIKENEFAVGHLPCTENTIKILQNFKKILLVRDIESINQSAKRWAEFSGRGNKTTTNVKHKKINSILQWTNQDVIVINFDEIIKRDTKAIDNLQLHLFGQIVFDSEKALKNALASNSLTKSTLRK